LVAERKAAGRRRRAPKNAAHAHSWRVGQPDGSLTQGVCKTCGARRDFVAGPRRWPVPGPKPIQALTGDWLTHVEEGRRQEVKMPTDLEERAAQRIALAHLVRGCEGAVSELLRAISEEGEQSAATRRAREILADMLSSWRQTLTALGGDES
jgi:hypothetical protein